MLSPTERLGAAPVDREQVGKCDGGQVGESVFRGNGGGRGIKTEAY